jgi:hypothetical protein
MVFWIKKERVPLQEPVPWFGTDSMQNEKNEWPIDAK